MSDIVESDRRQAEESEEANARVRKLLFVIYSRMKRWQTHGIAAGPKGRDRDFYQLLDEVNAALIDTENDYNREVR